jgi:ElaB/YqjD/DUF883 family membrane-anchored ribosome-binding protein
MSTFDKYLNDMNNTLNERSINKIQAEFTDVVTKMSAMAKEYATTEGDEKTNILTELKGLTAKKNELIKELDNAVAGKDKDVQLAIKESEINEAYGSSNPHAKPAGLDKEETMVIAQKFADAMSKAEGAKVTVNKRTLEEDSFDLDYNGEEFDGGSYNIYQNGNVMNMALRDNPVYGRKNDSVDTIAKNMKKFMSESVANEGRHITLKRQYTGNHPATTVGKIAAVRNKVLEAIKDGKIPQEQFEKIVSEISNNSKRWTKNNSKYFTISEDGVSLSGFGKKVLSSITVNEADFKEFPKGYNPEIWVPGNFDKAISKYSNAKLTRKIVLDAAKKWDVTPEDAINYVEFGWHVDLSENINININMKTKFIYESFSEFIGALNESNEILNEAFASTKLASLLTGANAMPKDLPAAFYNMSKLALDKIQDIDILEMTPDQAKKEKRTKAIYLYFTTNEKENPYAGSRSGAANALIPSNTLLAITDGSNEWMNTEWTRKFTSKSSKTLKTTKRDDSAGFSKSGASDQYGTGISSMKQVAELADRAYCLDLTILQARYSTQNLKDERDAARKGATAFMNDKEFKAENKARYNDILATKASSMPMDSVVSGAIDTLSLQIKNAIAKGEKGRYGDLLIGLDPRGKEVKLSDASNLMRNILDTYSRYVGDVANDEKEKAAGYTGNYYAGSLKNHAKDIQDNVKKIDTLSYGW